MNKKIEFEIDSVVRSKRKSVSINVLPNGKISIKAPKRATNKQINEIIIKHRLWILKRINNFKKNKYEPIKFTEGEKLLLLGKKYILKFENNYKIPKIKGDYILIDNNYYDDLKLFFEEYYKQFALSVFQKNGNEYASKLNTTYKKIKISSAKTRWGSCSSQRNINLSWRLIMAPIEVIDYVIVHELAHLFELNHSQRFWNIVESILPNYKQQKLWLKKNGHLLSF